LGQPEIGEILQITISTVLVIYYLITKHWILNNIIGFALIMLIIRVVRLNSFKVAFILLTMLFFYDIFWVFFSDRIFSESVMISVATRVDLPLLLELPSFKNLPINSCSMIGLGDIALPGFFINFAKRFGKQQKTKSYYRISMIGYTIALLICSFILIYFEQG